MPKIGQILAHLPISLFLQFQTLEENKDTGRIIVSNVIIKSINIHATR